MKKFLLLSMMCWLSYSVMMANPIDKQMALQIASKIIESKDGQKMAPAKNNLQVDSLSLSVTDFTFIGSKKATYNLGVDLTVKNEGAEFIADIYMFASTTEEKGKALVNEMISVEEGGELLVRMNFIPPTAGTYNIWVTTDEEGTMVIGQTTVEITVASDPVITFETVNKPAGWSDMTVMNGETQLVSGR